MKFNVNLPKSFLFAVVFLNTALVFSQHDSIPKAKSLFWQKVQFGGGLGLGIGNGFTNISVSPTGYYTVNKFISFGVGVTGSYVAQKSTASSFNTFGYKSTIFGGSLIGLVHPIEEMQLSVEVEQLKVNRKYDAVLQKDSFWNTALFFGAGYRTQNITLGVRYNVLHSNNNSIYSQAWLPFVRVIF